MNIDPQNYSYQIALDLGVLSDYTALTVIKKYYEWSTTVEGKKHPRYDLIHLKRYPLHTPYSTIVEETKVLQQDERLRCSSWSKNRKWNIYLPRIALDRTAVGEGVFQLFEKAGCKPYGLIISGGHNTNKLRHRQYSVPKKDLILTTLAEFEVGNLRLPRSLPYIDDLIRELTTFRVKLSPEGKESFENARERDHDDLVLSLCIGMWFIKNVGTYIAGSHPKQWK